MPLSPKRTTSALRGISWFGLICSSLALCFWPAHAQASGSTINAASCQQTDINAVINGPTHTAANGDTINIPAGSCTWTTGVIVPSNVGISIIGVGAGRTNITDNLSNGTPMILARLTYGNSLMRISGMSIAAGTSANYSPLMVIGTCTSSGCPNLRMDHMTFSGWSGQGSQDPATWMLREDNMFGVLDHNIIGDSSSLGGEVALVNANNSSYLGVGQFGDNAWAQPDSFGTANALFIEDNTFNDNTIADDCDISDSYTNVGGCRVVTRFNTWSNMGGWAVGVHGTETGGRMRGGRVQEVYNNVFGCSNTATGCNSPVGFRSADGFVFDNTFTVASGSGLNSYVSVSAYRTWASFWPWGGCNGESPFDKNDGAILTSASTFTSVSSTTLTDSSRSWTTNQFAPGASGKFYTVYDATTGQMADVISNTANTLNIQHPVTWSPGDTYYINGTTLYASGKVTGVSVAGDGTLTITDTSKSWSTNQWVNNGDSYTLIDISATSSFYVGDRGFEITGSTTNTLSSSYYSENVQEGSITANVGDTYVILRASVCLDQAGRGSGNLLSGSSLGASVTPVGDVNQTLKPVYEWGDTLNTHLNYQPIVTGTMKLIANRDFYYGAVNQTAQTSPSSPFTGATGTGYGTFADRPTSCTTGVAYWATDQGNWNQSANGGQGELYICTATNTWTMSYTPYTYPHPLVSGNTSGNAPNPPTGLSATVP